MLFAAVIAHGITVACAGHAPRQVTALRNQLREVRVALPDGATDCTLSREGTHPLHLDLVAVEQGGARLPLDLAPELRARDLTLFELSKPLQLRLPAPARGATLVLAGREELVPPGGDPFVLAARPYRVGAKDDVLVVREETHPASGHPDAITSAWVRDDGKTLHAKLDFASDDTDDHGDDYAELRVGKKRFRVTTEDARWGRVSMQRTDAAPYAHKVYEFDVPLAAVGAKAGKPLQLAFAAYGTASPATAAGGAISGDANRFAQRVQVPASLVDELQFYGYADGGWTLAQQLYTQDGGTLPDGGPAYPVTSASFVDPTATAMLYSPRNDYNLPAGPVEFVQLQADGGVSVAPTDAFVNPLVGAALSARGERIFVQDNSNSRVLALDGGVFGLEAAEGTYLDQPLFITADGTRADFVASYPSSTQGVNELVRDGGVWSAAADAGSWPSTVADYSKGSHARLVQLSRGGSWLATCGAVGGALHLFQHVGGGFQEVDAGVQTCDVIGVGEGGTVWFSDAGVVQKLAPPAYAAQTVAETDGGVSYLSPSDDGQSAGVEVKGANGTNFYYLGRQAATVGAGVRAGTAGTDGGLPVLSVSIDGNPTDLVVVGAVPLHLNGSLAPAVSAVHLFNDVDQNGVVSSGDVELGTQSLPGDGGPAVFTPLALDVPGQAVVYLLATADLKADAGYGTLTASVNPDEVLATTTTLGYVFAPAGATQSNTVSLAAPDAGSADAGAPDAGTTPPSKSSGCGCSQSGPDAFLVASGLLTLLVRRRRAAA